MDHTELPSLTTLDSLFKVDFDTGAICWRNPRLTKSQGAEAGAINSRGYRKIKIGSITYPAHRIVYAMYHRVDPGDMEIDHINNLPADNRVENLRLATRSLNCINREGWRKGLRGAYKKGGRWMAVIQVENKRKYLGHFDTEQAAHNAFCEAAVEYRGNTARLD